MGMIAQIGEITKNYRFVYLGNFMIWINFMINYIAKCYFEM